MYRFAGVIRDSNGAGRFTSTLGAATDGGGVGTMSRSCRVHDVEWAGSVPRFRLAYQRSDMTGG
jgi:hypothetical protein